MSHSDVWAVTPSTSATLLRAAAAIGGAGALTLLTNTVALHGCGYKLLFTSAGNDSGRTFTIVGNVVGNPYKETTETVTGANASTASSTNFWANIKSISIDGASAGNVSVGTTGSLALPKCRIKALHYVGAASAGTVDVNVNTTSGQLVLRVDTPATATWAETVFFPDNGIVTSRSAKEDFAIVTLTQVSKVTLICS